MLHIRAHVKHPPAAKRPAPVFRRYPPVVCYLAVEMKYKSYMKPVAKRLTISKPEQKRKPDPLNVRPDGFVRISDSKVRKVYLP